MWSRQEAPTFSLGEVETHVALAFLGDNETAKLLVTLWTDRATLRNLHRLNYLECEPEDASPRAIYNHIQTYIPELFIYTLADEHRGPLIEAFEAAYSLQQPTRADWLGKLPAERASVIAGESRDRLLTLSGNTLTVGIAPGEQLVLLESPQAAI